MILPKRRGEDQDKTGKKMSRSSTYHVYSGLVFALTFIIPLFDASVAGEGMLGDVFKITGTLLRRCWDRALENGGEGDGEGALVHFQDCLKRRSLLAMERISSMDRIRINEEMELVRHERDNKTVRALGVVDDGREWKYQVIDKVAGVFNTHILEISMNEKRRNDTFEGRRRHHQQQHHAMMPMLLFGTLGLSMIAMPLGFQFLAVLGGKALLLAKLALILTSIHGLKKIASSDLDYGLYHSPHHHHHHPSHHVTHHLHQDHHLYDRQEGLQSGESSADRIDLLQPVVSRNPTRRMEVINNLQGRPVY